MRIAFNRKIRRSPWGGGTHFTTAMADFLTERGHTVFHNLEPDLDAIVMIDPRSEDGGFDAWDIQAYKRHNPKTKVLHRVNDTDIARGTDFLDKLNRQANLAVADHTVYISEWVMDYYASSVARSTPGQLESTVEMLNWSCRPSTVITNGCDTNFFYPSDVIERDQRHKTMGYRPINLVTHHWSDNENKGLDLYKHLDELVGQKWYPGFKFTYIGRYPASYTPKNTIVIPPLYGHALGDELRKHDVYVTAARHEACGSHHVEGAASGMPIVFHNDGGGVVEMASRYGVGFDDVEHFRDALKILESDYVTHRDKAIATDLSAKSMCEKYLDVIEKMIP